MGLQDKIKNGKPLKVREAEQALRELERFMTRKNKSRSAHDYPFVLSYDSEEKVYIARAVDLPNCHTDGSTPEEAVQNIYEAIQGWLETAQKEKIRVPEPSRFQEKPKKFLLRIEPHNVIKLETLLTTRHKSLNSLINEAISSL